MGKHIDIIFKNEAVLSAACLLSVLFLFCSICSPSLVMGDELPDGVYAPDQFSWSGGSGRVSISCDEIEIENGLSYAKIVFSSPNYGYVKADGQEYEPTINGNTSEFTIPVALNRNTEIIGMTTAMSVPHEITYTIYVCLKAADAEARSVETTADTDQLSVEAPQLLGLAASTGQVTERAEYYNLFEYGQGIFLLEIASGMSETDDEENESSYTDEETGELIKDAITEKTGLYDHGVIRYLIVSEGVEIPVGLEKEMIIVRKPVGRVFLDQTKAGLQECFSADDHCEVLLSGSEKPDYRQLVLNPCGLAVFDGSLLSDEMKRQEVIDRMTTLGIPVLFDRSADEQDEAAAKDWDLVFQLFSV